MEPLTSMHDVRGVKIRMLRAGQGDPVVFLHGAGGLLSWGAFTNELAADHELIVPEHPGFGLSDTPDSIRNIADMAVHYLDFLDGLGVGPVHLVGTSLGGWIAAEAAVRNTRQIKSLVLIAPAGLRVKGIPIGDNFIWSPEENARNLVHNQAIADQMMAAVPSDEEADIALKNRYMAAKLGWEPRWHNPALSRWLHRIDVPTLILWGEEDQLFPASYAEAWCTAIAGARVERISNAGHLLHVEKASETARLINSFVGRR